MPLDVFIGYDSRCPLATQVAEFSLYETSDPKRTGRVQVHKLDAEALRGGSPPLYWRPVDADGDRLHDVLSNAPMSTEFAITRFLVPFMCRREWALFVDQDVVFQTDVSQLFRLADPRYAVQVVKHAMPDTGHTKMAGQVQVPYHRKNWSSVVLWNCAHPAHHRLTLPMVNSYPGDLLHRFFWLRDKEIGALPASWNWLVNAQEKPATVDIAHFTLGGPWIPGWQGAPHDQLWIDTRRRANL